MAFPNCHNVAAFHSDKLDSSIPSQSPNQKPELVDC
ncbi:hypothetical protein [Nodularia sp. UHCC 0506]|nr:hypothetical protein [Nodularia sp. UHCC 0506]MEA5515459.1 hypothetical protein [Nodularia sp. UHCC 0506]